MKPIPNIRIKIVAALLLLTVMSSTVWAQNETFSTGAYIIDMGQATQTVARGLKPYGLVYSLITDHKVAVRWSINPNKVKDGIDFTVGGKDYRGGTFIIPSEYINSTVLAKINVWRTKGVIVDGPIGSSFTAPVYKALNSWPRAVLDVDNGSIVANYYAAAEVPTASYISAGNPTLLNVCSDVYVLPHADPQNWIASWRTALDNHVKNGGYLWTACHAGSALEAAAPTYVGFNYLSTTGLIPWKSHSDGTTPYTYAFPADPVMQFMGSLDAATTNGSEQIYLPIKTTGSWRPTTKVAVYQPTHTQANANEAAALVYGRAYGNSNYGMVAYLGGHDHHGTAASNVAAMRSYFNFILMSGVDKQINLTANIPQTVSSGATLNFSVTPSGGSTPYTYSWSSSCSGGVFGSPTSSSTTYTSPATTTTTNCVISVLVTDACGKFNSFSSIVTVTPPQTDLAVVKTANNSTPNVGSNITFTITATNNGPAPATAVVVNDVLPAGYTFVSATPSTGTWTAPNWSIGSLANAATATLSIVATVNATGSYANTATITGAQTDPTPGNNSSTSTPVPVAITDLVVVKTMNNASPNVGSNITFTISATNNGPSAATNVVVNDVLQAGYTFVSATPSTGTWTAPNWSIGSLANAATATLSIVATVNANAPYTNTATITGAQTDPTPGNNSSTINPVPVAITDLAVVKTVNNASPNVGSNVTFTITATNNGPSAASNLVVNDVLPAGYTFVSATPSTGTWTAPNWSIGSLINAATATLSIVATVNANGPYANTATITGTQTDPTPGNNSSTSTPVPVATADLTVVKTVNNSTPNVGSNVTFTITATNNGPSAATNVVVNDVLPAGYTFVSATTSIGTWTAPNWSIGSLANAATATLSIVATVNAAGPYANTASITGAQTDPTPGNNSSTSTPVPVAAADLAVVKTVNNASPNVGSNITFTITATNNGPSAATNVVVNDVLPAGYTFVSATPSIGTWTAPNWSIGSLANAATATLSIVATVNAAGPYANTASITGAQTDPTPANNTSTVSVTPGAVTDLAVVKTVNNASPNVGSNVTFTITATNNGPSAATNVVVNDVLPAGYTFVSATPSTGTWTTPNWTIGNLANAGTATLSIVAKVNAAGPYANTASITGAQTDPTPANNTSTVSVTPGAVTDLAVVKTVNNASPNVGSNVTFTITATNNGPSAATNVVVNDVLPAGYTFVSATTSIGTWTAPNWSVGSLANAATATLSIVATVNAAGPYANTASITGAQTDPTPGNNSSTITPVPVAAADLAVVKTVNNASPNVGSNVTFTITATNNGPSAATNVVVNDVLPAGYTFVSATPSSGTWTAPNWSVGSLANAATATLSIVATVNAAGPYANTASITGAQTDPTPANNTSTVSVTPGAVTDLAVVKTVNNASPNVGSNITFTITATNNGPSAATNVVVNDVLPAGYTFVSATPSFGTWTAPNWSIGSLANAATATLSIVATVNANGPYANTATITGAQTDPTPANNTSTVSVTPGAVTDLAVVKTVNNASPNVGSNVTFTITATNNGPSAATNVVVNDVLPAGYTFVSATPSTGTWTAPNWSIGSLANAATATLSIVATVNAAGPYANTASITGGQTDPLPANNTSTVSILVGPNAINDNTSTNMNTPVNINVLLNDIAGSAAINPTTVTFVAGTAPNPTTQGVFTVSSTTGLVTFTPAAGFTGTVTINYQVCDLNTLCSIATITVVVNNVAGPDAINDAATTMINTPVNIIVLSNDIPGGAALNPASVTIVPGTQPNPSTQGVFTVNPVSGLVTFTPVTGFIGQVTANYSICDLNALCDIATITVNVIEGTTNLYPALGFGTLAFEDLWPSKGDYDFNDLVIDYQFDITSDQSNFVSKVKATFVIKAFGASFENGFGFQLAGAINPADLSVSGTALTDNYITTNSNGTEAGQTKPTIVVFDNAYKQMQHPGIGIGVNTDPVAPYVQPVTLTVIINFKPNTYSINDLDISNFNPFLIIDKNRSMEVHLPNYPPTSLANTGLLGTMEDASNAASGKYYVTSANLPWAINIYEKFDYPKEKQEILWAHLKFAEWAMSAGVQFPDWYKNLAGYRNNALIYQVPAP